MKFENWNDSAADVLRRVTPTASAIHGEGNNELADAVEAISRAWEYAYDGYVIVDGNTAINPIDESIVGLANAANLALYALIVRGYGNDHSPTSSARTRQALHDLLVQRQAKYGPKNIQKFGYYGILIRLSDKIERLKNLISGVGVETADESIDDTLADVVGYYVCAVMLNRDDFSLPLKAAA